MTRTPISPQPHRIAISVTQDELAMILHALAATAATFTTAALIIKGTSPKSFAAMGRRYTEFHEALKNAHTN